MRQLSRLFDDDGAGLRGKTVMLFVILTAANIAAWGWTIAAFGGDVLLLGTALLAYGLGLRHAVDPDHIAAIDNVTRKLIQEGKRPIGIGFFFALGHSTVVLLAGSAIALTAVGLRSRLPGFIELGSAIGTAVSAGFLLVIGTLNMGVFVTIWRALRRKVHDADAGRRQLEAMLSRRGLLARLFQRAFALIARSWHMYPLGILFGLGFDTASEIGLLGIAASEAAKGLSPTSILIFPALFMAGMSLIDATDGVLMIGVYGWAFSEPLRKLYYNLAVTGFSVIVAVAIGGIEATGLIRQTIALEDEPSSMVAAAAGGIGVIGYGIVGLFVLAWLVSMLLHRMRTSPDYPRLSLSGDA